ncbi:hypothetical protein PIB30_009407 [Stylosanthes scabra]|uniref:Uncharacterized protein n=1 Tax=Stylosanthes scabra TaxID=79078 RepID=A0ABU6W4R9_9FABA|nr:hypothetical protein [Stylosanthes scabra]
MVSGAWMLDGATKDRVYALSLASRIDSNLVALNKFVKLSIESIQGRVESIRNLTEAKGFSNLPIESIRQSLESTPHSKFHEPPKIESIRWVIEPIRFHPVFKFNVQNAFRIDFSSSESILMRRNMISKGFQRLSDDDWSGCISCNGPSRVVSAVGSLFPRGTKANVAAHGSFRGGLWLRTRLPN